MLIQVAPHEIFRVEKSESISATPLLNNDTIELNHEKSRHDDSHSPDARDKVKANLAIVFGNIL